MQGHAPDPSGTLTYLIQQMRDGDGQAQEVLFQRVYADLRRIAQSMISNHRVPGGSLNGTELVNMAYCRLVGRESLKPEDRRHLFFLFGRAMHDVIVEEARKAGAAMRGGGWQRVPLVEFVTDGETAQLDVLDLHGAMSELQASDPAAAQVVELRYFAGRTNAEVAETLGCTPAEARGNWEYARAWLSERLSRGSN